MTIRELIARLQQHPHLDQQVNVDNGEEFRSILSVEVFADSTENSDPELGLSLVIE